MLIRKLSITTVTIFYFVSAIYAQSNSRLVAEMKQLQKTYKEAAALQFDIRYVYTTESRPAVYLDSVKGKMEINGNNYRMILAGTETIKNDRYVIHVFKDDKLIYLTKPPFEAQATNPATLIDSAFANVSGLTYNIDSTASLKNITLNFPKQSSYKKVVFTINKATGYITKVKYVVKTEQLLEVANHETGAKVNDEYGIVEAAFSNYRTENEDPQLFDEKFFFVKTGNEYTPVDKYKDFSIFLGSPNL